MATFTRRPFAEMDTPRLQALHSAKNRQNAVSDASSAWKPATTPSTGKRQRGRASFQDDVDSENIDPDVFRSPTKRPRAGSAAVFDFVKPSTPRVAVSPPLPPARHLLSPAGTTKSAPLSTSRGSPKHQRVSATPKRRASSSRFRRVDPPSLTPSSPALPFSIDAALSGTIAGYTPKATIATRPTPAQNAVSTAQDAMPKSWFFEIHEDTPEQEAANLMEHSASVLDISSDDDYATKQRHQDFERGKENVPPLDFLPSQPRVHSTTEQAEAQEEAAVKRPRLRKFVQDAMDEDRRPLGDLAPSEFYGEGCDASSYVTVDGGIEKPSGLSKEFEFVCPTPEKQKEEEPPADENSASASVDVVPSCENDCPAANSDITAQTQKPAAYGEQDAELTAEVGTVPA